MGLSHSQNDVIERSFSDSKDRSSDELGSSEVFIDQPISEDLLIGFLSYVPAKDLILNCRLVCKQWKYIIDSQSVWRLKCEKRNVKLPTRRLQELPKHHYRYIYLHAISGAKNLIVNPCGESKLDGWSVLNYSQESFEVENPPAGADPVPAVVGSQSCFATTYTKCEKYQIINLAESPVNKYLLQHDLVKIKVGEWYAARFDCASEYELKVHVFDYHQNVIDKFEFEYVEEQWTGKEWHLATYEFDNVTDAFFLHFRHAGKDRQFWAGHYGSKMTGAFVELCIK